MSQYRMAKKKTAVRKELMEPGFLKNEYLETELSLESTLDGAVNEGEMDERVQNIELEHLGTKAKPKKK